ncbi:urease accessory protein UreF [Ramlibacter monticola]|uniref:Urease accessory protein UreF n=1 Tax=Ramlibacter monticola TaxID=1926872 RepID=A0A937CUB4_9BURK|nr:urease accessory UreF family protein [Ramlibacter monticola]MBL0393181.1 urease accessory protein UreF [Ramlibacter monticola]
MASTDSPAPADTALLHLIWLASPALPVGGFSYSEGLEAAVEAGLVGDERSAGDWLVEQLHASLARSDLAVVGSAVEAARHGDGQRLRALDAWVRQTRETSELRQQVEQMGRSLGEWVKAGVPFGHPQVANSGFTYPVAFAVAAAGTGAAPRQISQAFAFGWSENMVQAAVKAVPLGQGAGQRILARLAADIPQAVVHALELDDDHRQAFTPMLAILSSQHETQYSRLFRS